MLVRGCQFEFKRSGVGTHMFDDVFRFPSYQFHVKKAELSVNLVKLVDHGPNTIVFLVIWVRKHSESTS